MRGCVRHAPAQNLGRLLRRLCNRDEREVMKASSPCGRSWAKNWLGTRSHNKTQEGLTSLGGTPGAGRGPPLLPRRLCDSKKREAPRSQSWRSMRVQAPPRTLFTPRLCAAAEALVVLARSPWRSAEGAFVSWRLTWIYAGQSGSPKRLWLEHKEAARRTDMSILARIPTSNKATIARILP